MTSRKQKREQFWSQVDMNEYHMSDIYREKVDKEWSRFLWEEYKNEKRTNTE